MRCFFTGIPDVNLGSNSGHVKKLSPKLLHLDTDSFLVQDSTKHGNHIQRQLNVQGPQVVKLIDDLIFDLTHTLAHIHLCYTMLKENTRTT